MKDSKHPEADFLADVTASATHEVRNVLAIIKESAGLIDDMVLLCQKRGTLDPEKVQRAIDRIDLQVKRGADLLTGLNRLSHTLDSETAMVDLNREVEQAAFMSQRSARKKGLELQVAASDASGGVRLHHLYLHMVLHSILRYCFDQLREGMVVEMKPRLDRGMALVEFSAMETGAPVPLRRDGEAWDSTRQWIHSMGASLTGSESGAGLLLSFPETAGG